MKKDKERLSGKAFEELIYRIYKELEPHAEIVKNDMISGIDSGIQREIDISIRAKIAGHEILIIVQAKDHKKRADIKILGEFDSVIRDVRASRGILICNSGFTKAAKDYAKSRGIDLYSAHDASILDWQTEIKIPVIRKHRTMTYKLSMPFEVTEEAKRFYKEKKLKFKFFEGPNGIVMERFDGTKTDFFTEFLDKWNKNEVNTELGTHKITFEAYAGFFDTSLVPQHPAELEYTVSLRHYLKFFSPTDYRGIKDYVTEKFRPSFVKLEGAIPFAEDKTWFYIENPSDLSLNSIVLEVDIVDLQKVRFFKARWKEL